MAESTPEQPSYPGQQPKSLYAQKIRYRGRRRKQQPKTSQKNSRILLLGAMMVLLLLLLRML